MRLSTFASKQRLARRLAPSLLCLGLAACGGELAVGFGFDSHHHHDRPNKPDTPAPPPPAQKEPGVFLVAGDLCDTCSSGSVDGAGSAARFNGPEGVAADSAGNLYVTEKNSSTIRKITPQGIATTLAGAPNAPGSADGVGLTARFNGPTRLDADEAGNLYVTDTANSTIRKITPAGVVTTLAGAAGACGSADGNGAQAQFCKPQGIALDRAGNLFVTDTANHTVRKITPAGAVSTVAGAAGTCGSADGRGTGARFCEPQGIVVDSSGYLYVADTANSTIRMVSPEGQVTTLAGRANDCGSADGGAPAARFCAPSGITLDWSGNLFVADSGNSTIRRIDMSDVVSTVAGVPRQNRNVLGPLPGGLHGPLGVVATATDTLALTSHNLLLKVVLAR